MQGYHGASEARSLEHRQNKTEEPTTATATSSLAEAMSACNMGSRHERDQYASKFFRIVRMYWHGRPRGHLSIGQ